MTGSRLRTRYGTKVLHTMMGLMMSHMYSVISTMYFFSNSFMSASSTRAWRRARSSYSPCFWKSQPNRMKSMRTRFKLVELDPASFSSSPCFSKPSSSTALPFSDPLAFPSSLSSFLISSKKALSRKEILLPWRRVPSSPV